MVPMASGRDADVYALDDSRVLRRYRRGGDATAEAATMAYVRDRGFPAPRVHSVDGPDLVLERVYGPTMLDALADGAVAAAPAVTALAELHGRLHALPARGSAGSVIHLDLHPGNVILSPDGPVVIDWRTATEGPPDLDLAMSALIMAEVAVDTAQSLAALARAGVAGFLAAAGGDPLAQLDRAVALRRTDPNLSPAEVDRLATAAALVRRVGA